MADYEKRVEKVPYPIPLFFKENWVVSKTSIFSNCKDMGMRFLVSLASFLSSAIPNPSLLCKSPYRATAVNVYKDHKAV